MWSAHVRRTLLTTALRAMGENRLRVLTWRAMGLAGVGTVTFVRVTC